ncbi:MAG: hypothetical protein ACE5E5_15445, partial [Phycisphaerae bacterium]
MVPSFQARCALLVPYVVMLAPGFGAEQEHSIKSPVLNEANPSEAVRRVGGPDQAILYDMATRSWSFVAQGGPMPTGEPVYVNEPPDDLVFPPGADRLIADDIHTVAVGGCDVSGYEVQVGRSANWCSVSGQSCETADDCGGSQTCDPRPDSGFSVDLAIYDGCPGDGGEVIPGTEATVDLPTNGLFTIVVDLSAFPIPTGNKLWVSAEFDKAGAGWVVGRAASMGFTSDSYDHPFFPCLAGFGFAPVYAGFHTRVFCTDQFDREFVAYLNPPRPDDLLLAPDAGQWLADDVELIADDCVLSSYEIASIGTSGPYSMDAAIWSSCGLSAVIEGTQGTFQGVGDGSIEVARFDFPDGVPLNNGADYWVAWRYSNDSAAAIIAEEPEVGVSSSTLVVVLPDGSCGFFFSTSPFFAFAVSITCLGDPPIGACCRRTVGATCEQTIQTNCVGEGAEWIEGAACDPDPFDAPCGTFACCLPDPGPQGECQNLTPDECTALGGLVDEGRLCDANGQDCGWFACRGAVGECCTPASNIGCGNFLCCSAVCDLDPSCCQVEWDTFCADRARGTCNVLCPDGLLQFLDPPADVVDARQPSAIDDASQRQGIDSVNVFAPGGSGICCWSVCETGFEGSPNYITAVTLNDDGTMTLDLARPITPGNVTTLTYTGTSGVQESFSLTA